MGKKMLYDRIKLMWLLTEKGPGWSMKVEQGNDETPWKLTMTLVEGNMLKGTSLGNGRWDEVLFHAIKERGQAYIQMEGSNFTMAFDPDNSLELVGKTLDFEIVGRYIPPSRSAKKKGINGKWKNSGVYFYRFGETLTADIYGLALYLFGEINPYTVGQAYAWNNQNEYKPVQPTGENTRFRLVDFLAAGNHFTLQGKIRGAVFYHRGYGFINGLEELKELFPEIDSSEVRRLYRKFEMDPSTHIRKIFGEMKTPNPNSTRRTHTPQTLDEPVNPGSTKLYSYIREYDIRRDPSNPDTLLMYHSLKDNDINVSSVSDLAHTIRVSGGSISQKMAKAVWTQVMGKGE